MMRIFGYPLHRLDVVIGFLELSVFYAALVLSMLAVSSWDIPDDVAVLAFHTKAVLFSIAVFLSGASMGVYRIDHQVVEATFIVRLAISFLIAMMLLALVFYIFPSISIEPRALGLSLAISFVATLLLRDGIALIIDVDSLTRRVLVLGAGSTAGRIAELTDNAPKLGFRVVGYVPIPQELQLIPKSKTITSGQSLLELARLQNVDDIVVAADDRRDHLPLQDLQDCKLSGVNILDTLAFFEREMGVVKIDLLYPGWIVFSQSGFNHGVISRLRKRALDLLLGSLLLLVAIPIMLVVTAASLIESRGRDPVVYHQIRIGKGGVPFRIKKFRSMQVDAEADGKARWAAMNDSRVTRLGAFLRRARLDELPQLLNVLKGEMSLVGPRPERPAFVEQLAEVIPYYDDRHQVKPGITGWAQLMYPYGSNVEDAKRKLEFDLYYIKNTSLVLDVIILLQTIEVVFFGKGAR